MKYLINTYKNTIYSLRIYVPFVTLKIFKNAYTRKQFQNTYVQPRLYLILLFSGLWPQSFNTEEAKLSPDLLLVIYWQGQPLILFVIWLNYNEKTGYKKTFIFYDVFGVIL